MSGDREVQRTMLELLNQLDGFSSGDEIKIIAATNRPDILDPALMRSGARPAVAPAPRALPALAGVPAPVACAWGARLSGPRCARCAVPAGRLDRKIEFPHPNEEARAKILQVGCGGVPVVAGRLAGWGCAGRAPGRGGHARPPPPLLSLCVQIHSRKMSVSPDVNFEELARGTDDFNAAQLKAVRPSFLSFFHSLALPSFLVPAPNRWAPATHQPPPRPPRPTPRRSASRLACSPCGATPPR